MPPAVRQQIAHGDDCIRMAVTFYPPDRRKRDDDGCIGAIKNMRDGIADALGCDDARFKPDYRFAEPCKPGRVEIVIGGGA
jgi:crossover junction endodeoxyribonuclease RusA